MRFIYPSSHTHTRTHTHTLTHTYTHIHTQHTQTHTHTHTSKAAFRLRPPPERSKVLNTLLVSTLNTAQLSEGGGCICCKKKKNYCTSPPLPTGHPVPLPRVLSILKISSDFCSRGLNHLILYLKRPRRSIRSIRLKRL